MAIAPVVVRTIKVASKSILRLKNLTKPKIPVGHELKVRGILLAGKVVVPTLQTSELAGLQGDWNSWLPEVTGRRWQPILKVNPPETSRNQN